MHFYQLQYLTTTILIPIILILNHIKVKISKIVMNFKTGASIPAIINLASHKVNRLSTLCDYQGGDLKLKLEVKLSLLAEIIFFID